MQWGEYFTQSSTSGIFLKTASRIIHGLEFEDHMLSMFPVDEEKPNLGPSIIREQMKEWLHRICLVNSSDDFAFNFRTAVFEACLPINASLEMRTRRAGNSQIIPLTLLQHELGYEIASKISHSFGLNIRDLGKKPGWDKKKELIVESSSNKKPEIEKPEHNLYQWMILYMFAYTCFHEQRVNFIETYYITQSKILESLNKLKAKERFYRTREPFIVRLRRRWYINYVRVNIDETKEIRWLECADATEACLFWMYMLKTYNEGETIAGHLMSDWINKFLTVRDFELEDD